LLNCRARPPRRHGRSDAAKRPQNPYPAAFWAMHGSPPTEGTDPQRVAAPRTSPPPTPIAARPASTHRPPSLSHRARGGRNALRQRRVFSFACRANRIRRDPAACRCSVGEAEFERQLTNIACTRISHLYKTTPEHLWYSVSVKGVEKIGILPKAR
jgi:hypothetical protein